MLKAQAIDLEKILRICDAISKETQKDNTFKLWIEKNIINIGKKIFQNNLSQLFYDNFNNNIIIIITDLNQIIEIINNLDNENNLYYIKLPENIQHNYIFKKFLSVLSVYSEYENNSHFNNNIILFLISFSPLLYDNEIVLNIYNIHDISGYSEISGINTIFNELNMTLINKNHLGQIQNNISFINPKYKFFLEDNKIRSPIFDLHCNSDIDLQLMRKIILILKYQITSLTLSK
ncbi:MAG: hypothetical protein ACTSRP_05660 [Candidatus Helarchaeota archaeon]